MLTPVKTTTASSAEKVSSWISPAVEPSRVNAAAAPNASRSKNFVPSPTSSSGVKAIRSGAVRELRVGDEVLGRGHDLGHARLVVGPEQRRAVGRDEVVAHVLGELRQVGGVEREVRVGGKREPAAVVARDELRLHVRAADRRARVDVGDQPEHRHLVRDGRRHRRRHVAVLVEPSVVQPDLLQLLDEEAREVELLQRGGVGVRALRGLRVDHDVAQEALERRLGQLRRERRGVPRIGRHSTASSTAS